MESGLLPRPDIPRFGTSLPSRDNPPRRHGRIVPLQRGSPRPEDIRRPILALAGSLRFVALPTEQSGAKATNRSDPGAFPRKQLRSPSAGGRATTASRTTSGQTARARASRVVRVGPCQTEPDRTAPSPGKPGRAHARPHGPGQKPGYTKGADSGWAAETESPVRSVSPRKKPGLARYMMSISTAPRTITPIPRTNTRPTPPTEEPDP